MPSVPDRWRCRSALNSMIVSQGAASDISGLGGLFITRSAVDFCAEGATANRASMILCWDTLKVRSAQESTVHMPLPSHPDTPGNGNWKPLLMKPLGDILRILRHCLTVWR